MKTGIIYPQTELGGDPEAARRFALAAEARGFDHFLAYDHVAGASHANRDPELTGPYTEKDMFHDPLVMFAYLAGITKTIRFVSGVMILLFVFNFAVGIMLSLSPIVVVMENRGVIDSFRRSFELVKLDWTRILGIHAMWAICVVPILLLPTFLISIALGTVGVAVFFIVALSVLIAYTRTLQMVAYLDLRMRHEHFDRELLDAWTRNRRV